MIPLSVVIIKLSKSRESLYGDFNAASLFSLPKSSALAGGSVRDRSSPR